MTAQHRPTRRTAPDRISGGTPTPTAPTVDDREDERENPTATTTTTTTRRRQRRPNWQDEQRRIAESEDEWLFLFEY